MDIEALPALHWERKAEKARAKAKTMNSADARRLMYDVARRYRQMAGIARSFARMAMTAWTMLTAATHAATIKNPNVMTKLAVLVVYVLGPASRETGVVQLCATRIAE